MINKKRIVITGVGVLSSLGCTEEEIVGNALKQRTNISKQVSNIDGQVWHSFLLHKLRNFKLDNLTIGRDAVNIVKGWSNKGPNKDLSYFLATIGLALEDSGATKESLEGSRAALVLAHENPGLGPFFAKIIAETNKIFSNKPKISRIEFLDCLYDRCEQSAYDLQTFMYLFFVAKMFGIHEYSSFLNNACASGLYALESASRQIQLGNSKIVIVSAVDHPDIYKYLWFKKKNLYSSDGAIRPFCENSNGIVFGEGGASLVLEEFTHAKERKAKIYAEYLGGGFSLESWKVTFPDVTKDYYSRAFIKAMKNSNVNPGKIDYVNPHGVGIKVTDMFEARTIVDIFKNKMPLISAYKPLIGHNLGGSALLETALLLISLKRNLIFPTLNSTPVIKNIGIELVTKPMKKKLFNVAKMSCGFAGFNGVAIFRNIN